MADSDIRVKLTLTGSQAFSKNLAAVTKQTKQFGKDLKNTGDAALKFGANIAKIGAAVAVGLGGAATRFAEFEQDFTAVVTLLDDTSFANLPLEQGIDGLREGVLALRGASGETFDNLNDGLFNLISAGVPAAQALESLKVATDLALAGVTDTAIAVDGITTALGAFGDEAGDATDISEKFFAAQKAGKTTIEELSSSVGLVAATAQSAGVNFEELLGSVSSATVAGIRTNAAFTGLKAAIANIQKPTADAEKEAERLGITFDATALRSKGLIGLFEEVTSSANFNSDSFIKLFGSVEALNFANAALAGEGLTRTRDILGDITDETGRATTFQNALTESQKTLSFQFRRFVGIIDSVVVGIGQRLSPAFGKFLQFASGLIETFRPAVLGFFDLVGAALESLADRLLANQDTIQKSIAQFLTDIGSVADEVGATIEKIFTVLRPVVTFVLSVLGQLSEQFLGISLTAAAVVIAFLKLTGGLRLMAAVAQLVISSFLLLVTLLTNVLAPLVIGLAGRFATLGLGLINLIKTVGLLRLAWIGFLTLGIGLALNELVVRTVGWNAVLGDITSVLSNLGKIGSVAMNLILFAVLAVVEAYNSLLVKLAEVGNFFGIVSDEGVAAIKAQQKAAGEAIVEISNRVTEAGRLIDDKLAGAGERTATEFGNVKDKVTEASDEFAKIIAEAEKAAGQFQNLSDQAQGVGTDLAKLTEESEKLAQVEPAAGSILSDENINKEVGVEVKFDARTDPALVKLIEQIDSNGQINIQANIQGQGAGNDLPTGGDFVRIFSEPLRRAAGGFISGKGTSTSDSIPSMLSSGEFVMKAKAVRKFGTDFMHMINHGTVPKFADGGLVDAMSQRSQGLVPIASGVSGGGPAKTQRPLNLILPDGRVVKTNTDESTAKRLERDMRKSSLSKPAELPAWY